MLKSLATLAVAALTQTACFGLFDTPDTPSRSGRWEALGTFSNLDVHGHKFHTATLTNGDPATGQACTMQATVYFDAPVDATYRFRAKLTTLDGSWVKSPEFFNETRGPRSYSFTVDTTSNGCWGAKRQEILMLDVAGCQGAFCQPNPLN